MAYFVSEVKRRRRVFKLEEEEEEEPTFESELGEEEEESEEVALAKAEEIWEKTDTAKRLEVAPIPILPGEEEEIIELGDEEEEDEEEEEEEKREKRRKKEEKVTKYTETQLQPVFGGATLDFQFEPLTYEETNGKADSYKWHDLWWQKSAALEPFVIHNPERIPDRGDAQFETMIRVAEAAPAGLRKDKPGRMKKATGRKIRQSREVMEEISSSSARRVRSKLSEPARFGDPKFDKNSIRLIRVRMGKKKKVDIQMYHEPQLTHAHDRSFVLSLDKQLTPLKDPVPEFNKDTALNRLFEYARDMSELRYVKSFVLSPSIPDRSSWEDLLIKENTDEEDELLINIHSVPESLSWKRVFSELRAADTMTPELWENVVLTSVLTGRIPWIEPDQSSRNWTIENTEKLLDTLELLSTVLRKYDNVVNNISLQLDDDVSAGIIDRKKKDKELERRLNARIRPFVIAVRTDPYDVSNDIVTEVMLNAFYGVERDENDVVSQITQEGADNTTESMRLLPFYTVSTEDIETATVDGRFAFDEEKYVSGSYNYANRVMVSNQQAASLGSIGLEKKVSQFRTELIQALHNYRQMNMRHEFLKDEDMPHLVGLDVNSLLCSVASYIHNARDPKISEVLREAVRLMPQLTSTQSRRSRSISQYLLYYALAKKLSLFEDGYLKEPVPPKRKEKRKVDEKMKSFLDIEAEEEEEEEEEEDVTLDREKRLLRVAATLYNPNNVLSTFDRREEEIIDAGWFLKWAEYESGVKSIKDDTRDEVDEYREIWLKFSDNSQQFATGKWPLQFQDTDGEIKTVVLTSEQAFDSIPFIRDMDRSVELTVSSLHDSFYSAISVRELMKKGREVLPDVPKDISKSFPLVLERDPDTDVKQRAFQVAQVFVHSGYLLPSNFDSLAAALTIIQLIRLLSSNATDIDTVSVINRISRPDFSPSKVLKPEIQNRISCAMLAALMSGNEVRFMDMLHYASVQDIRVAAALGLQIDYWRSPSDSKNAIDDIRTNIANGLMVHLLENDDTLIDRYNETITSTNKVIREKSDRPEILTIRKKAGIEDSNIEFIDFMVESEYEDLTLDALIPQIKDENPVVVYTPWLSIQKALRLYLSSLEKTTIGHLCSFVNDHAGSLLDSYYIRTDCGEPVVIDVRRDDIVNRETFRLMKKHSLVYHGEDYDTHVEAVISYFNITTKSIKLLDKLNEDMKPKLGSAQKKTWEKVKESSQSIDSILETLNKIERKQFAAAIEIMTNSNLVELVIESDGKLHQSRTLRARAYVGYIFKHDKTAEDGTVSTVYTPVYPGYERQLSRLLDIVSEAKKQKKHWLDLWKDQYRTILFTRMRFRDDTWKPFGESKEFSLNMEQLLFKPQSSINEFDVVKSSFEQPPVKPGKVKPGKHRTRFSGFVAGNDEKSQKQRDLFLLFSHIMGLPSGLGMLPFFVPDAINGRTLHLAMLVEGIDFLLDIHMTRSIAQEGVSEYINTHTPEATLDDIIAYVDRHLELFERALNDVKARRLSTSAVQQAALLFEEPVNEKLAKHLEIGIQDVSKSKELVEAIRYSVSHPGEVISSIVNKIAPNLKSKHENRYRASFLRHMDIPFKSKRVIPVAETIVEAPEAMEIEEKEEEKKEEELSPLEELLAIVEAEEAMEAAM